MTPDTPAPKHPELVFSTDGFDGIEPSQPVLTKFQKREINRATRSIWTAPEHRNGCQRVRGRLVIDPRPTIQRTKNLPFHYWIDVDGKSIWTGEIG